MDGPERAAMRWALELAERGWGRVAPNPMVGAVVVRDGHVVGEGWHAEYGGPHAEVVALNRAGPAARGATLVVTLEPCAHHGRTPPCTDAIIAAGIARVVFACADPNRAAAGGAERLLDAGIAVARDIEGEAARALNASFFHAHEAARPFVALKLALSLDARLSDQPDAPAVVTGPAARAYAHRLRAGYDAVVVGIGTALADDPLLTVRDAAAPRVPPRRVVLDSRARLPEKARLVRTAHDSPVWHFHTAAAPGQAVAALAERGVRTRAVAGGPAGVAWNGVLEALAEDGADAVLVEGGGRVAASLLAEDRVQRMHLFYAPHLYGQHGAAGFPGTAFPAGWRLVDVRRLEGDVLLTLDRAPDGSGREGKG
ncbi:MAG: bifunctional diaminohydroxyphosphoribosylaminopyrimidine deaminase/5-amino-6-(5-phosphoribosylamino)uracil reductase RibD [Gemmatimonadota bacterium]